MSTLVLSFLLGFLLLVQHSKQSVNKEDSGPVSPHRIPMSIGGVVDTSSRVGKEQKLAMEMAVHDLHQLSTGSELVLINLKDSYGNSAQAAYAAIDLIDRKHAEAIVGPLTLHEASVVRELNNVTKDIPIMSIAPIPPISPPLLPPQPPSFIQMSNDLTTHMQCIAAIVGHFRWRKVTAIYEQSTSLSTDSELIIHLSDSLLAVDSVIERHTAFPPISSLTNTRNFIEEELKKLRSKSNRVFILIQSSLDFAAILFEKAKQMGMMEKGYVWIVTDDIASLLDSVDPSAISNMQGVIGFKTNFIDTTESYRQFRLRFRRNFRSEHPEEEEHSDPSIFALRAYDATLAIARAMQISQGERNSKGLINHILSSDFEGLSGRIRFNKGQLSELPIFRIINVIGKSYREVTFWSPLFGFSQDFIKRVGMKMRVGNGLVGELGSIYWPGSDQSVPKGWSLGEGEKPMKIGVPARGAFNQFVNVNYDPSRNETSVTGFSIEVFEAAVNRLPYDLPYVLVPYYGSYDEMVAEVHNKVCLSFHDTITYIRYQ
ncbi:unnamed protein product [Ilex paraguariensis]|uniref:Receptor ligand binding region domain-containing protein n=1 Tax=Ilex paraguariensis TaxID=185542 RepID=A0ABC8QVB9_9AQUA